MDTLLDTLRPLVERVRTDVTFIKVDGGIRWTKEALTEERLRHHLDGGPARGAVPIEPGMNTTRVALLDLDSHKGEVPWPQMQKTADYIMSVLTLHGLRGQAFRSSGGAGIHIYMIWDEAQDAYSVREKLRAVLEECNYQNGTKGIAHNQIEIFPKQDQIAHDGTGNGFTLPLAEQSAPLERKLGLEVMDRDWPVTWISSDPVELLERPQRELSKAGVPLLKLEDAIKAIDPDEDYEVWYRCLMALHHESQGSDEGLEIATLWSAGGDKYKGEQEIKSKWNSFRRDENDELITGQYILQVAGNNGWLDETLFDAVEAATEALPPMIRDAKGRIEPVLTNVLTALGSAFFCRRSIHFDEFKDEIVWTHRDEREYSAFTDADYTDLRCSFEQKGFKPLGREMMRDAVHFVADRNRVDTALEWISKLEWDGVPRVKGFLTQYFNADATEYAQSVSLYLWTALAGRVLSPGVKCDMVPILVGAQGIGKSVGVGALVPAPEFATEISFAEREDDLSRKMRGRLIAEIGELRGLHTKEMTAIKQFVTKTHESWVPKYKEFTTTFPRRLVFVGTTNEDQFLADATGNRRWLPIRVGSVDIDGIKEDRLQLWAEAAELFKSHDVMWERASQLGAEEHEKYMYVDSWEKAVEDWLKKPNNITQERPIDADHIYLHDVLFHALGIDTQRIMRRDEMRAGNVLRNLGYTRKRLQIDGARKYVFAKNYV